MMRFQLYTDGGSRGNPGPSAYAYIIFDGSGREVASRSDYLGLGTNNEAEYQGLLNGLKEVLERGGTEVEVFMDSELVVNQLKGRYRVKARNLLPLYEKALHILDGMRSAKVTHVRREDRNIGRADAMLNWVLDQQALAEKLRN